MTMMLETSVGTLEYEELGEGPPVVFVHGYLTRASLWRQVAARLDSRARCVLVEWPMGSHRSPLRPDADLSPRGFARLVDEVLGLLDLDEVTLVGNDSGGAMSQIVATEHPERIGGLVLTTCDAFENFPPKAFRPLVPLARSERALRALLAPIRFPAVRRSPLGYGLLARRPLDSALTEEWVRPVLGDRGILRDNAKLLRGMNRAHTERAAEKLPGFEKPALIAWSDDPKFFPLAHGRRLAELLPQGRFELVEGARTYSPLDRPDRVADLVASLLPVSSTA